MLSEAFGLFGDTRAGVSLQKPQGARRRCCGSYGGYASSRIPNSSFSRPLKNRGLFHTTIFMKDAISFVCSVRLVRFPEKAISISWTECPTQ